MKSSIVVTDGEQRATLATVRSLGRAGHRVHVCATRQGSLAAASRFADGETVVPDPLTDPDGFNDALIDVLRKCAGEVLLPISEPSLLAVLPDRQRFPCSLPFPTAGQFERICDKDAVLAAAAALGIDVPAQRVIASPEEIGSLEGFPFPIVLKPSRSVAGARGARRKATVRYARDQRELAEVIAGWPRAVFPVLCQQRIVGPGTAISLLVWEGEAKAAFAHRRLREKPPSGGVSVLREAIPLDRALMEKSLALLGRFDWQGVAMVEFKVEQSTGRAYIMEVNGRLWGSLQLAIDSGVDFPRLLVDHALGRGGPPVLEYANGVRTRWEWGEVDHLVARLLHRSSSLALPPGAPSRLGAIAHFVRDSLSGARAEVFHRDDPRPFLRESVQWFTRR